MCIFLSRNGAVLYKDIGPIQTRNTDAHKLQHPVGRLIKSLFSHFNYGIYHGFVVIHHNLQATTTPSIMVSTWFRFTCLWMLARERVGGAWLVAGPMTFSHQPDLAGQGLSILPRQPFLVWPSVLERVWRHDCSYVWRHIIFNEHTSTVLTDSTIRFHEHIGIF